jgi:adenylate cyclase
MQQVRLPRFNAWLSEHGQAPFRMGIGINTGPVMAGNVGSERRLEYAAVGDTTNVAARLESLTRSAGHDILVGEATAAGLGRHAGGLEPAGTYRLRGRSTPVAAWAPSAAGPYAAAAAVDRNASASRETPSSICSVVTPE